MQTRTCHEGSYAPIPRGNGGENVKDYAFEKQKVSREKEAFGLVLMEELELRRWNYVEEAGGQKESPEQEKGKGACREPAAAKHEVFGATFVLAQVIRSGQHSQV